MSDPLRATYALVSDAARELEQIAQRLRVVAEMLVEHINAQHGLESRPNEQRWREDYGDGHGPV